MGMEYLSGVETQTLTATILPLCFSEVASVGGNDLGVDVMGER